MYPYLVSARLYEGRKVFLLVVDSERNPLESYLVKIDVGMRVRASCSCPGFAIRGKCKHLSIAMRRVRNYIDYIE